METACHTHACTDSRSQEAHAQASEAPMLTRHRRAARRGQFTQPALGRQGPSPPGSHWGTPHSAPGLAPKLTASTGFPHGGEPLGESTPNTCYTAAAPPPRTPTAYREGLVSTCNAVTSGKPSSRPDRPSSNHEGHEASVNQDGLGPAVIWSPGPRFHGRGTSQGTVPFGALSRCRCRSHQCLFAAAPAFSPFKGIRALTTNGSYTDSGSPKSFLVPHHTPAHHPFHTQEKGYGN